MRILQGAALIICAAGLSAGCANPLNQATSNRYAKPCHDAESGGRLDVAEEACYRALVNVNWGHLGNEQKSQTMYNLARIKRKVGKFEEAETLLKGSLEIEAKQPQPSNEKIGRRLAELSMVYGQMGRYQTGLPYVEKLYAFADLYQGNEKKIVSTIFYEYSRKIEGSESSKISAILSSKASEMGFDANEPN
ncbi:MAG TPA: tetratricopeptide repeat protein [Geobacteraceae bacterium]|nr:tetratricopeptide repeat protein [Geobacteraceae bacterium]